MLRFGLVSLLASTASSNESIGDLLGSADSTGATSAVLPSGAIAEPRIDTLGMGSQARIDTHPAGPSCIPACPQNPLKVLTQLASPLAAASSGVASQDPFSGGALSQESMRLVGGLIEAFMHKAKLEPGEKSCLENNLRQASGDIMGTVGNLVTIVKALIKGKGTVGKKAQGGIVATGISAGVKITSLVTSSMQLMKNCVHGDALNFLKMTAQHMANATYLEDHFIVNGVDIVRDLSDSVIAFDAKNFHKFGTDIGLALRKIVLSNAQNGTATLPEGMPKQEIIEQATDGLMRGFFVRGSFLEVTDKAHRDIDLRIDLHQCIAGNSMFFKQLWMAMWNLIAQFSTNSQQHGLGFAQPLNLNQQNQQPKWQGELMVALMQLPTALSNCGVAENIQTMFSEAIESLSDVRMKVTIPHNVHAAATVGDDMARAVEAWTNFNFKLFGFEIGKLLRELVMAAIPQKYGIDSSGTLTRYIEQEKVEQPVAKHMTYAIAIMSGAVVFFAAAFTIVRTRRTLSRPQLERDMPKERDMFSSDLEGVDLEDLGLE